MFLNIGKSDGLEVVDIEFVLKWKNRSDRSGFYVYGYERDDGTSGE